MKDYEAVVVGAGLGGLSAAAFLARAGKKVLLLERHNVPGGYATTFTRGRFEFEVSLHELSGLGHEERRGPLWRRLQDCDVAHRVEFLPINDFYRSIFPDLDVTLPAHREGFEEVLCRQFPAEAEEIKRFTNIMFTLYDEVSRLIREGQEAMGRDPAAFSTLLTYMNSTLEEAIVQEIRDYRARAVVNQLWGYYGQPPSRLSFLLFAIATATHLKYGPVYVKGKSQALSQAFVDSIEENGDEVWLNHGVSKIQVAGGKVRGVVTDDESEIIAPYVVCNVNPITTCIDLIGRGEVPNWFLRRLGWGKIEPSIFCLFLGLDCPRQELGLNTHEIAINTDYDPDRHFEMARSSLDVDPQGIVLTPYNVVDPEFSPPGTTNIAIATLAFGHLWSNLPPHQYVEVKNRIASRCLDLAERIIPDLRNHLEVVEVSTPLTNMRFTGNVDGAVYGYANTPGEAAVMRLPNRGPLEGLYFAGAWTRNGGGFQPCIDSGYQAAMEVLEDEERGGRDPVVMEGLKAFLEGQSAGAGEIGIEPLHVEKIVGRLHPRRVALQVSKIMRKRKAPRPSAWWRPGASYPIFAPASMSTFSRRSTRY
jgi:prolycopene isomerase